MGIVGYLTVFVPALADSAFLPPVTALSLLWLFVLTVVPGPGRRRRARLLDMPLPGHCATVDREAGDPGRLFGSQVDRRSWPAPHLQSLDICGSVSAPSLRAR